MKKITLMLLVLIAGISQIKADDVYSIIGTINSSDGSSWDTDWDLSTTDGNIYTGTFTKTVTTATNYKYKVRMNHAWNGGDFPGSDQWITLPAGTYDLYFEANVSTQEVSCTYVPSVDLYGSFSSWGASGVLTRTGVGTYTGTLDLSATAYDQKFKLFINGTWRGFSDPALTVTPNGLISDQTDEAYNLILLNSTAGYKTYDVTAVWTPSTDNTSGWTLTFTGKDARTSEAYSVSFVKVRDWKTVNAYIYSNLGNNDDHVKAWPGTAIAKSGTFNAENGMTYDVYTYNFNSTFTPGYVIFNDGTYQTADLVFTNGKQYADDVPDNVYAAVGANYSGDAPADASALFFDGMWNAGSTTDFMTLDADGHTYFINFKNKSLTAGTNIYTKVIDKATTSTAAAANWYPTNNKHWYISADGTYDISITFNSTYGDLWNDNAVTLTVTETPATINVSAGSVGKATFSSEYPLDFTGITDISAYTISELSATSATLTKVTGVAPAETGLLIIGEADANADVPTTTAAGAVGTNYLVAALTTTTINSDYAYILYNGEFHPANAGTIPAGRAYLLKADVPAETRSLALVFEGEATEINTLDNLTNSQFDANAPMYNLAGQRVNKSYKGVVIQNGKKIVRK